MIYRLTPAAPDDEPFLAELFADVRAAEFAPLQLPPPALAQLLALQARAQRAGYLQQYPDAEDSIVWVGAARVGRVLLDLAAEELRLIDIALLAHFRGQGIGRHLLEDMQARAAALHLPLRLSVRPTNPAARLYQRLGFVARSGDAMNAELEWRPHTGAPNPPPVQPAPQDTQSRCFRRAIGEAVSVVDPGGSPVELRVESVDPLALSPRTDPGDSFAVYLRGALQPRLPQNTYTLRFADGSELEIFLGPIRELPGGILYEAIFNRAQPSTETAAAAAPPAKRPPAPQRGQ